jgi:hypothetical protein
VENVVVIGFDRSPKVTNRRNCRKDGIWHFEASYANIYSKF